MDFYHLEAPAAKPLPIPVSPTRRDPNAVPLTSLTFLVTRVPFSDYFTIYLVDPFTGLPNGMTEELDVDETYAWFRARGADMNLVEKALDHIWSFAKGAIEISKYKEPPIKNASIRPQLD